MAIRIKHPREHSTISLVVVFALASLSFMGMWQCHSLISRAMDSDYEINAAVVALIGQQVQLTTLALTGLAAILTSTSPKPTPTPTITGPTGQESVPVTAVNTPAQPVPTDPQPADPAPTLPPTDAMPDPDGADPGVLEPDPAP